MCVCLAVVPGACFLGTTNVLNIAMAFGLAIFVLVYAAASFSGEPPQAAYYHWQRAIIVHYALLHRWSPGPSVWQGFTFGLLCARRSLLQLDGPECQWARPSHWVKAIGPRPSYAQSPGQCHLITPPHCCCPPPPTWPPQPSCDICHAVCSPHQPGACSGLHPEPDGRRDCWVSTGAWGGPTGTQGSTGGIQQAQ